MYITLQTVTKKRELTLNFLRKISTLIVPCNVQNWSMMASAPVTLLFWMRLLEFVHNPTPSKESFVSKLNYCKEKGYIRLLILNLLYFHYSRRSHHIDLGNTTHKFTKYISRQQTASWYQTSALIFGDTPLFIVMNWSAGIGAGNGFGHCGGIDLMEFAREYFLSSFL